MHCSCCDRLLNDYESTRKSKTTGEYLDICNKCYTSIAYDVPSVARDNLEPNDIPDEEIEFEFEWSQDWGFEVDE